jgi:SPOR domain
VKVSPPDPPQGAVLSAVFGTPHRVLTESIKPATEIASRDKPEAPPPPPPKPRALALAASPALEKGADATGSVKPATTKGETTRAKSSEAGAHVADASSVLVQLGSSPSKSEALATLSRLRKQFPDVLHGGSVRRADQGSMGVFYRVQVGPLSRDAADKVCSQLKSSGASCIVTHT